MKSIWWFYFYWTGSGSGTALIKFCGSGSAFNQCGSISLRPKGYIFRLNVSLKRWTDPAPNLQSRIWNGIIFKRIYNYDIVLMLHILFLVCKNLINSNWRGIYFPKSFRGKEVKLGKELKIIKLKRRKMEIKGKKNNKT